MMYDGLRPIGLTLRQNPLFDEIVASAGSVTVCEGDTVLPDGGIMCGKCFQPKTALFNGMLVPRMCQCERERLDMELFAQKQADMRREQVERLRREGVTQDFSACRFDLDDGGDPRLMEIARSYAEHFDTALEENTGLMFYGNPGGGKTFAAGCIANAVVDQGRTVMLVTVAQLLHSMAADFEAKKNTLLQRVEEVDLLVLDDVGFEADTAYKLQLKFEIFDARTRSGKPMIMTTNTITPDRLRNPQSMEEKRLYSRIRGGMLYVLVNHADRRDAQHTEKAGKMRGLLGL